MQSETTVAVAPAPQTTVAIAPIECPICAEKNPPGEQYCVECGFLLSSAVPEATQPTGAYPKLRDATGREFLLKAGENLIGRDPSSDVLLTDGTVSRRHALIIIEDNRAYIQDLGSTNGTRLNGELIGTERIPLPPNAELQFGSVVLTLELPEGFETPTVAAEVAPPLAYLVNLADPSMRFPLYARPLRIGRRPTNDIVIPDAYVSGQHATIEIVGSDVRITDLGSTNGTFINDTRITPNLPTPIPADAILTLGKTQFRVEWAAAEPSAGAPAEPIKPSDAEPQASEASETSSEA
ncbi:MAG: FHA domain-containing protein [Armatimonadota bacterium]|nr:FHA domain-containing protein [Armatimonadota bacterium]